MQMSRGKKHDYLDINLEFSIPGEARVTRVEYVKKLIEKFPEKIMNTYPTLTAGHMFEVHTDE